jgi:nitroreductase
MHIGDQVGEKLGESGQMIRGLVRLVRKGQLMWLLCFVEHKARYRLDALYSGIAMNRDGQGDIYNFRRNIHRIEKGLLREQLKPVFAEDYVLETVSYLRQIKVSGTCDRNTIAWGEAVLGQYFRVCEHTGRIADAYAIYCDIDTEGEQPWYPYRAETRPHLAVQYDDLYQLALRRRSIRYYQDRVVEFETVRKAMAMATLSPSACNRQSYKFLFYNDKDIVSEICKVPGGFAGFEVPSVMVVVGRYRGYFDERDVNVPIIDASLAVMAFILALETLGLSSVCINWPSLPDRDEVIRKLIHLDRDEFVIILIGAGYAEPQGKVPYSVKRDIDALISCNERIIE